MHNASIGSWSVGRSACFGAFSLIAQVGEVGSFFLLLWRVSYLFDVFLCVWVGFVGALPHADWVSGGRKNQSQATKNGRSKGKKTTDKYHLKLSWKRKKILFQSVARSQQRKIGF